MPALPRCGLYVKSVGYKAKKSEFQAGELRHFLARKFLTCLNKQQQFKEGLINLYQR